MVDDGSTDGTEAVLKNYRDRVKVIYQNNAGANPARNRGLAEAEGEFLIFCDADVIMKPQMIEKMHRALMNNPATSYAYSGFWFGWKHFPGQIFNADRLRRMNYIHTTSLVRAADFPGFDNTIKRLQDWDVWLTMLERGKVGVLVPETLFKVGIHGASRIGSSWLPSFVYKIPWTKLAWKPTRVAKYEAAKRIIQEKHGL